MLTSVIKLHSNCSTSLLPAPSPVEGFDACEEPEPLSSPPQQSQWFLNKKQTSHFLRLARTSCSQTLLVREHKHRIRQPASFQPLRNSLHNPRPSKTAQPLSFSMCCALLQKEWRGVPLALLLRAPDAFPPPYSFPHFHTTPRLNSRFRQLQCLHARPAPLDRGRPRLPPLA